MAMHPERDLAARPPLRPTRGAMRRRRRLPRRGRSSPRSGYRGARGCAWRWPDPCAAPGACPGPGNSGRRPAPPARGAVDPCRSAHGIIRRCARPCRGRSVPGGRSHRPRRRRIVAVASGPCVFGIGIGDESPDGDPDLGHRVQPAMHRGIQIAGAGVRIQVPDRERRIDLVGISPLIWVELRYSL